MFFAVSAMVRVGAPVIGVLYGHDRVPAGVGAGDDRVLHRFGAGLNRAGCLSWSPG